MKSCMLGVCATFSALLFFASNQAAAQEKHEHEHEPINEAVAVLVPSKGSTVSGVILLKQEKGYVHVTGEVKNLTPGKHGFHIHMFGDLRSPDGMSAGGHYNPHGKPHGKPDAHEHHEGDLGNIDASSAGVAKVDVKADGLDLHHVIGRGVVVHKDADDFSQPVGNAGPRIAVGVIGLAEVKAPPKK
ncbi:MAG: superoxide dismutase family protein [Pirellulales bacterium]